MRDPDALSRIRSLGIPPGWRDVWIAPDPHGHLQAMGIDQAGRRQYLYHPEWRLRRDAEKFERMVRFAHVLPTLRDRIEADTAEEGLSRERVLACAVRLLDVGLFRVGTEEYASRNGSIGLATLERRHVRRCGERLVFDYPAKGGIRRVLEVEDPAVAEVLGSLKRRRAGAQLLAYREGRRWTEIRAADINGYIKQHAGEEFSAKDFRTWHGTVLAAVALAEAGPTRSRRGQTRAIAGAMRRVARYLGNTPAVARRSYVDPRVIDRFRSGWTIPAETLDDSDDLRLGPAVERAVLDLLQEEAPARAA